MNSEEFSDYPLWEIISHAISLARDIEVIYEPGVPELCQRIIFIGQYVSSFSKSDPLLLNEQLLGPVLSDWRAVDLI